MARQIWDDHAPPPRQPSEGGNDVEATAPAPPRPVDEEDAETEPEAEPVS